MVPGLSLIKRLTLHLQSMHMPPEQLGMHCQKVWSTAKSFDIIVCAEGKVKVPSAQQQDVLQRRCRPVQRAPCCSMSHARRHAMHIMSAGVKL